MTDKLHKRHPIKLPSPPRPFPLYTSFVLFPSARVISEREGTETDRQAGRQAGRYADRSRDRHKVRETCCETTKQFDKNKLISING